MGTGTVTVPASRNTKVTGVFSPACSGWVVLSTMRNSPTATGLWAPAGVEPAVLVTFVPGGMVLVPSTSTWLAAGLVTDISSSAVVPRLTMVSSTGTFDPAG
jgi:hypothetical protein